MESAVGRLIQEARMNRRPKWSQQFLADELSRVGYETTREQIARMERSEPCHLNAELFAAVAGVLRLDEQLLQAAMFDDYLTVAKQISLRIPHLNVQADEIPTRVPTSLAAVRSRQAFADITRPPG
jgi:hypothetical protein